MIGYKYMNIDKLSNVKRIGIEPTYLGLQPSALPTKLREQIVEKREL